MIDQQHQLTPAQTPTLPTGRMLKQLGSEKQSCEIDFASFERFANAVVTYKAAAAAALFELGTTLNEAKATFAEDGVWLTFLKDSRVNLEPRIAQMMMAIARERDGRQLADHGIAKATLLLQNLNLEARNTLLAERGAEIQQMTVKELRAVVVPRTEQSHSTNSRTFIRLSGSAVNLAKQIWRAGHRTMLAQKTLSVKKRKLIAALYREVLSQLR